MKDSTKQNITTILISFFVSIVTSFIAQWLIFSIYQAKHDENMIKLNTDYAIKNALFQKKMEYAERILETRQLATIYLDNALNSKYPQLELSKEDWQSISDKIKITNANSLLYSKQPYRMIIQYDGLYQDIMLGLMTQTIDVDSARILRKELGRQYDFLIEIMAKNNTNDSSFTAYLEGAYYDLDTLKPFLYGDESVK